MGNDFSCHPIDERVIRERILPYVMGNGNIDDLVAEAIRVKKISTECKRWATASSMLESEIFSVQSKELPRGVSLEEVPIRKKNFLDKLLGRTPATHKVKREIYQKTTGIPGFDCDLHLYGRPFFIDGDDPDQVITSYQKYLLSDLNHVPNLALETLESITSKVNQLPSDVSEEAIKIMLRFYPLRDNLVLPAANMMTDHEIANSIMNSINIIRDVWQNRNNKNHSIVVDSQKILSEKYMKEIPYYTILFATSLMPGWMGRGYNTPSNMLSEVGADIENLFAAPTKLFESIIAVDSRVKTNLISNDYEQNSLGSYVEPSAVADLVALLEKHKEDIINLNSGTAARAESLRRDMLLDWQKAMEAARCALKYGYGFMEASDIYSGFLDNLN